MNQASEPNQAPEERTVQTEWMIHALVCKQCNAVQKTMLLCCRVPLLVLEAFANRHRDHGVTYRASIAAPPELVTGAILDIDFTEQGEMTMEARS